MKKITSIFEENGKVNIVSKKPDAPQHIDTFLTVRIGISWPTSETPGYFCAMALEDKTNLSGKKPLKLLAEREHPLMQKFFERLVINAKKLHCERLFANLEHNERFENSLREFVRERKFEGIRLFDSHEFEDFQYSEALIHQWKKDGALYIPDGTILKRQIQSMKIDDLKDIEKKFYAVAALCRVLASFEFYPWRKPHRGFTGFSNFADRRKDKDDWDGSYQEMIINE